MSPSLKAFLALVFVAAMGAVLIRPILSATDAPLVAEPQGADEPEPGASPAPAPTPTPRPSPSPEPTETPEGGLISGPFRTQPLQELYPQRCLNRLTPAPPPGRVAAVVGDEIRLGTLEGDVIHTAPGIRLAGFNLSERSLVALRSKHEFIEQLSVSPEVYENFVAWAFSPITNCSLRLRADGTLFAQANRGGPGVLAEDVKDFVFAPDGQSIAVVLEEGETTSVWVADLDGGSMKEVQRERTGPRVSLEGWSPDGRTLYLTFDRGNGLSFITVSNTSAPPLSGRVVAAPVTSLEQCGDRLLGVVEGAIADISTGGPDLLTETDAGYTAVSCAPNGGFLAAIRDDNLFLLDGDGRELRDLTLDAGLRDVFVDWGDQGAGLLFGRIPADGGEGQVWHLAEGGAARNTGLVYTPGRGAIDWSASPPTGVPAR